MAAPDEFQFTLVLRGEMASQDALADTQRSELVFFGGRPVQKNMCRACDTCTALTTAAGHMVRPRSTSAADRSPRLGRGDDNARGSFR